MRRFLPFLLALAFVVSPLTLPPPVAAQADSCQFVLGFLTLKQMIPDIVGPCLDNVSYDAQGNGYQHTLAYTGALGLLEWRKSDNFTAFTDGYRTWVNGPYGLQTRLNSQRFFWEFNPERLPIVPTPVAGERCHTAGLALTPGMVEAGAGNRFVTFTFTNTTDVSCTMYGFPGAQMLDAQNNPVPTNVVRNGGQLSNQPGPTLVTLGPGGTAKFIMHWEVIPVGNETTCPSGTTLLVTPPDEFASIILPFEISQACNNGELDVSAIQPSS
ncbi:MAG: DUF4232 domain-containing protein [Dehalococcoidales bacterium]|nr:DUF4232 domain-containing protein [Dehalococcoidales bacterium]